MPQQEKSDAQINNNGAGTRYIGEKEISMRDAPGFAGKPIGDAYYGESVEYTGNKKKVDGLDWAEIKYGNETRWILANCLRVEPDINMFDRNAPTELLVKNQKYDAQARTEYLNENVPNWIENDEQKPMETVKKKAIAEWYRNSKKADVKYTGPYCLPVPINRINQGFYGLYSHAGANHESGYLGAIDFQAPPGTSIYSVLGGKVVYTYKEAPKSKGVDMHRVTVETKINGEIYYLEYLHMDDVNVETGQTLHAGTQLGKSGGWGNYSPKAFNVHLDFRVYKFKDDNQKLFYSDSAKQFFDPLEFFDFDVQFEYDISKHDYH